MVALTFQGFLFSLFYEMTLRLRWLSRFRIPPRIVLGDVSTEISEADMARAQKIARALKVVERYAPWRPKCYNLAMTASKMLKDRNVPHENKVGFRKVHDKMMGHAWVVCQKFVVTGQVRELRLYKPLKPIQNKKASLS